MDEEDSDIPQGQLVLSAAEEPLIPSLLLPHSEGEGGGANYSNPDEIELPSEEEEEEEEEEEK